MDRKNRKGNEVKKKVSYIEIVDGDMYLKIPKNRDMINNAVNVLKSFDFSEDKEETAEMPEPEVSSQEVPVYDINMKRCPVCDKKLKTKVIKRGDALIKQVKCKKKKCGFTHEFAMKV